MTITVRGDNPRRPETTPVSPLMREFLAWVAGAPRTYAETMEAWRTSCPRQSIWEDTLAEGLVRLERGRGTPLGESAVSLTSRGRFVLDRSSTP